MGELAGVGGGDAKTLVFVGEKNSGKTSLIAKYLDEATSEETKATVALDYRHGIKQREEKKVKVNVYELGGGRNNAHMLGAALNERSIANTTVVITVDLSSPGNSVSSLLYWLNSVREQSEMALGELSEHKPRLFQTVQNRIQERWADHEDRSKVNHSLVPIMIVGTKFDAFAN